MRGKRLSPHSGLRRRCSSPGFTWALRSWAGVLAVADSRWACGQRAGGARGAPEAVVSGQRSWVLLRERFTFPVPPTGTRNAVLNTEARTTDADVLSRRCVLMRLLDFSYEQYQKALRQSAGAVVIILPRAMAAVPQDVIRVRPCPTLCPGQAPERAVEKGIPGFGVTCVASHFTPLSPCPSGSGRRLFPMVTGPCLPGVTFQGTLGDVWGHLSLS